MAKGATKYHNSLKDAENYLFKAGYNIDTAKTSIDTFCFKKVEDEKVINTAVVKNTPKGWQSVITKVK